MKRIFGLLAVSGTMWFVLFSVIVLTAGGILADKFWTELADKDSIGSATRNVVLIIAGVLALPMAIWRGHVAEQQVAATRATLANQRYATSANMLSSEAPFVRLSGISALQNLALEDPNRYHVPTMRLLCAFVRDPIPTETPILMPEPLDHEYPNPDTCGRREDIQSALQAISTCHSLHRALERRENFRLDLHGADLRAARLSNMDFSNALWGTAAGGANLCFVDFSNTNLQGSCFAACKLHNAKIAGANLSGACFRVPGQTAGYGLTQQQMDTARADPDAPPNVTGLVAAESGTPIVWGDVANSGTNGNSH